MIWLILVTILAYLFWYLCVRPMNHFAKMGVKQHRPLPFFGNHLKMIFRQQSFLEFIEDAYNYFPGSRYGGVYQFTAPILFIKDRDLARQLFVKDFDHFTDHRNFFSVEGDPLAAGNLFSLKGQKWKDMRATLSGSFTGSKMKNMFLYMNETAENFVSHFNDKKGDLVEIEFKDAFTRYANDVIATTAFGITMNSMADPENEFYLMGRKTTDVSGFVNILKFFGGFVTPKLFKILKIRLFSDDIMNFFKIIVNQSIKFREEKNIVMHDMINQLLEARNGLKQVVKPQEKTILDKGLLLKEPPHIGKFMNLTNDDITAQAMVIFFAGFDTSSNVMCFGAYELAINKHVQDKLRKEIRETHKSNNGKLTYESLLEMKYIDMVVSEILRKWPPTGGTDRVVTQPYTIEPLTPDESPVHLKVGDVLFFPIIGYHRDPAYYSDPLKFDPERFSDENKESIPSYAYVPFGVGPRSCISTRFSIMEVKVILYHLILNFEIVPTKASKIPVKLVPYSIMPSSKGGFWFGLKKLSNKVK
ncbi:probable cytochrome P450 9f2 [Euwallacea similis]|uniref:probable cytochrome P450 9f2 n=1 Tax=Euwallacea similis TaxID=1736056 RepID=UPI00344CC4C7